MAKLTVTELRKQFAGKTKEELIQEISTLYQKIPEVKELYQLNSGDAKQVAEKDIIMKEFAGKGRALPKARLSVGKKAISDLRKLTDDPELISDVMLTYVESVSSFDEEYNVHEEEYYTSPEDVFEAVKAMRTHIDQPSEKTLSVLRTLLNRVVAIQGDSMQRIHGKEVRSIRCWDVLIVEDALHCMLHPHAAGEIAYRTARDYTEKYNPSYGTGLIPESVPMLQDIIQFWANHNFSEGKESDPVLADTSEGARKTKKRRGSIRKAQDVQTIRMVKVTAAGSFEDRYPKLADWVQDGWIEIGYSEGSDSFIRVIDEGGLVWEGKSKYSNVDEALKDAEEGVQAWLEENT